MLCLTSLGKTAEAKLILYPGLDDIHVELLTQVTHRQFGHTLFLYFGYKAARKGNARHLHALI
jgi:hypothetical protein